MGEVRCCELPLHARCHTPEVRRLQQPSEFSLESNATLSLRFTYTFVCSEEVHFAFYYPFSYSDCQRLLGNVDKAMAAVSAQQPTSARGKANTTNEAFAPMYFHRELLAHSVEGRRVELLTITDPSCKAGNREARPSGLFPDTHIPRPHIFKGKPAIYIGARVHPGETAASYMVHGLLAFLLQPRNAYAAELRKRFVFKLVPMINPDGVFWGHFRTDTLGVNLNRQYAAPQPAQMPTVHAIKEMLKQLAATYSPPPPESLRSFRERFMQGGNSSSKGGVKSQAARGGAAKARTGSSASVRGHFAKGTFASRAASGAGHQGQPTSGLWMCLDLHGFTARRGCYILANSTTPAIEARALAFANTTQLYAPQFNASACSFGRGKFGPSATAGSAAGSTDKPPPKRAAYATPYGTDVMDKAAAAALQRSARVPSLRDSAAGGSVPFGSGAHGSNPGYDKGTASSNELWAATTAGLLDPYELQCDGVPSGLTFGKSTARMADGDASRLNREWAAHKARATARAEGNKEGAGRVTLWKELKVPHSYTVEGSCNLLNHTRVFSRLYSGPALHKGMLATVGPSTTPSPGTSTSNFTPRGSSSRTSAGLRAAGSRALGGVVAVPLAAGARTIVHCEAAKAPLLSQIYTLQGCGPGSRWSTPEGVSLPLPAKVSPSALAADASLAPVAAAAAIPTPYNCAVDALQPPPRCPYFSAPFGFHSTPPSHTASGQAVNLYEEHFHAARQTQADPVHATAQYACGWGTCPHDPPAAFAAVGRGLAFSILELSGGCTRVTSRLPHSVWGSLEALHRWSRRRVALAAGLPLPSDSALAEVIGPAMQARAPAAASHVPGAATTVPHPPPNKDDDMASTDTGGSDSDSDASLSGLAAVQESERRAFALVRDARSPSPPTSDSDAADGPVWGAVVPQLSKQQPAVGARPAARLQQHAFAAATSPVHAPGGALQRRAHLGRMKPPAALQSDPAAYFSVSGVAHVSAPNSAPTPVRAAAVSHSPRERSRRGVTTESHQGFEAPAAASSSAGVKTRHAFMVVPSSLELSGKTVDRSQARGKPASGRQSAQKGKASRLTQRANGRAPRSMPSILPTREPAARIAAPAPSRGAAEQHATQPADVPSSRKPKAHLRGWSASSSTAGSAAASPRLSMLN